MLYFVSVRSHTRTLTGSFFLSLQSTAEWQLVFWITFAILLGGSGIYCMLTSGERQEWDKTDIKSTEDTVESQSNTAGS